VARIVISIDTESNTKIRIGQRLHHMAYDDDIRIPVQLLIDVARRTGLKYTFFLPLGELIEDYPQVIDLCESILNEGHDIQVHRHLPFPTAARDQIIEWLSEEVSLFRKYLGFHPRAIRAGGYSVGFGNKWISSLLDCGFWIDSSVWSGANTFTTDLIYDEQRVIEEKWWGKGALGFNFRNAPLGGAYFCRSDNIAQIGESSLMEIPITVWEYDERNPWQYRFDPDWQTGRRLVYMIDDLLDCERPGCDLILNMSWHSSSAAYWGRRLKKVISWGSSVRYPEPGLRAFTNFAKHLKILISNFKIKIIRMVDIQPSQENPCVLWGRHQTAYWYYSDSVSRSLGKNDIYKFNHLFMLLPIISSPGECTLNNPSAFVWGDVKGKISFRKRLIAQPPLHDLFCFFRTAKTIIIDCLKSIPYMVMALVLFPFAILNVILGQHIFADNDLRVPPKCLCAKIKSKCNTK